MKNEKEFIMKNISNKLRWLKENTNHNVAYIAAFGSQNYGMSVYTDEYQSDVDVKAIIIPSLDDILKGKKMFSHTYIMDDNSHIDCKDIRLYIDLWRKSNPAYLEILFTEYAIVCNSRFKALLEMADDIAFANKDRLLSCIKGMQMEKYKALKHPYPTIKDKIDKYGYDPKQFHHMFRLLHFGNDICEYNKSFREALVPRDDVKDACLRLKTKPMPIGLVDHLAKNCMEQLKNIVEHYRDENDLKVNENVNKKVEDIIYHIVSMEVKHSMRLTFKDLVEVRHVKMPMKDTKGKVRERLENDYSCKENEMVEYDIYSYFSMYNHWEV